MPPYVFGSMKWWQNHFDVITISLTQDYRKEKEELKETMALEVVTDSKNDKTENTYTTREHGTEHVFCFVCRLLLY